LREQRRCLLPHVLTPGTFYLVNATAIAVSHEASRTETADLSRSPRSFTMDSSRSFTPKGSSGPGQVALEKSASFTTA
jgi:hypothetical protein